MSTGGFLDQLLGAGQQLAGKARDAAERGLGVPEAGEERDAMLSGLGKGAAAGAVLALLLGTRGGRRLTGSALKIGSLAALGTIAYKAYKGWQQGQSGETVHPGRPINELSGADQDERSALLLRAMIAAANADGHIDEGERARIQQQIQQLDLDTRVAEMIQAELTDSLDVHRLASDVSSPEAASEVYLASFLVSDADSEQERAYLRALAEALNLSPSLVTQLELEAST